MEERIDRRHALAALAGMAWLSPAVAGGWAWRESSPEAQGMDPQALRALIELGRGEHMDSLLVVRHGAIVSETYYEPFEAGMRHAINSATKGIVAALVGIAVERGLLPGTEVPMLEFFPGREVAHVNAYKRTITLQHLLDMSSGLDWTEPLTSRPPLSTRQMRASPDWVQFVLDRPTAMAPGQEFNYSSGNSHLISAILQRAAGRAADDFAREHLFGPLEIQDFEWQRDPQGVAIGGFGLRMTTRDMAKIALLYLQGGQWEGRQVVPRAWVERVHGGRMPMKLSAWLDFRYGDQWWKLPEFGAVMAVGFNRQVILLMPDKQLAAAMTGRAHWDFRRVLGLLREAAA